MGVCHLKILLDQELDGTERVLDVGCGDKRYHPFTCKEVVTLDAWPKCEADITLDLDTNDIPFEPNSFDVVLMFDFIEHLERSRGEEILQQGKEIASKSLYLYTPITWEEHGDNSANLARKGNWYAGNKWAYHKSLWTPEDFKPEDGWIRLGGKKSYYRGKWLK